MATVTVEPFETSVTSSQSAGVQATVSSEAPDAGEQIIVQSITACLAAGATPPASVQNVLLRDGAAGIGVVRWAGKLQVVAGASASLALSGLNIAMTAGNVATLEFLAAGGATVEQSVAMTYFRGRTIG